MFSARLHIRSVPCVWDKRKGWCEQLAKRKLPMSVVVPVAIIVFNRPDHTRQSFSVVREQQPSRLFVIADGPRPGHPTDEERCAEGAPRFVTSSPTSTGRARFSASTRTQIWVSSKESALVSTGCSPKSIGQSCLRMIVSPMTRCRSRSRHHRRTRPGRRSSHSLMPQ